MIKDIIKKYYISLIGIILGGLGGYAYYFYIGCTSGTCPITSNPYISIAYGGLMGYLLFNLLKKENKKEDVLKK